MMPGDQAPLASGFAFSKNLTHGIRDFSTTANSSGTDSKRSTFKFDGHFYRARQAMMSRKWPTPPNHHHQRIRPAHVPPRHDFPGL
jgi:hypothetical protein